jgi:hypothetical protein
LKTIFNKKANSDTLRRLRVWLHRLGTDSDERQATVRTEENNTGAIKQFFLNRSSLNLISPSKNKDQLQKVSRFTCNENDPFIKISVGATACK